MVASFTRLIPFFQLILPSLPWRTQLPLKTMWDERLAILSPRRGRNENGTPGKWRSDNPVASAKRRQPFTNGIAVFPLRAYIIYRRVEKWKTVFQVFQNRGAGKVENQRTISFLYYSGKLYDTWKTGFPEGDWKTVFQAVFQSLFRAIIPRNVVTRDERLEPKIPHVSPSVVIRLKGFAIRLTTFSNSAYDFREFGLRFLKFGLRLFEIRLTTSRIRLTKFDDTA